MIPALRARGWADEILLARVAAVRRAPPVTPIPRSSVALTGLMVMPSLPKSLANFWARSKREPTTTDFMDSVSFFLVTLRAKRGAAFQSVLTAPQAEP